MGSATEDRVSILVREEFCARLHRQELEADLSFACIVELKNKWSCTSTSLYALGRHTRSILPLPMSQTLRETVVSKQRPMTVYWESRRKTPWFLYLGGGGKEQLS